MRLAARLIVAAAALGAAGVGAGCAAAPGLAYAHGATGPSAAPLASAPPALTQPALTPPASAQPVAPAPAAPASPAAGGPSAIAPAAGPAPGTASTPRGVKAKAGLLVDATTGQVIWAKDANAPRPIASLAKVMTALVVIEAGNLDQPITVPRAVVGYVARNDANAAGLIPGQVFTADELLHAMLIMSACDAAYTLASAYGPGLPAFIAKMNAEAARLGLADTHFTSPDGLPYPTETSTYSTPAELVTLAKLAMSYPQFRSIVGLGAYVLKKGDGHSASFWYSSNELIGHYPGVIGIKTGFTDAAGHTLLFEAVRNGRTLLGVVLGSPPTGPAAGAQDATRLLNWGFARRPAP